MTGLAVVGALIRDGRNRVYVHRRSPDRRLLPGTWDIVGGHVEPGESPEGALVREIEEETGWRLRRIEADGDRRLRDLVARAVRIRLTSRLRLSPLGPWHAGDLWRLHYDEAVATWHAGRYTAAMAEAVAANAARRWEADGTHEWIAYDRADGSLIGRGGVSLAPVDGAARYQIGWTVRGGLWGRGYATEIGAAGLAFAFDDLGAAEVVAFAERANHRSRAVMERLGMRYTGDITRGGAPFVRYATGRGSWRP